LQFALLNPPLMAWAVVSLCLLVSPLQAQSLHITLLNGDCDGDNEVTLLDFGIVVSAMGSVPGDPNWDPRADLDGDGEVTLFDVGIVERNFGQVGAEPFDPTLPRLPAPNEGYHVCGIIRLQEWYGGAVSIRLEAFREDAPEQIVYYADFSVEGEDFFSLYLPDAGLWRITARIQPPNSGQFLAMSVPHYRQYSPGDSIRVLAVQPAGAELFSNLSGPIPIVIHVVDYDEVSITNADRDVRLTNKVRETMNHLDVHWRIRHGGGMIDDRPAFSRYLRYADYHPPALDPGEFSRTVQLECTVYDRSPIASRRDEPVSLTITLTILDVPTIHSIVGRGVSGGTTYPSLFASGLRREETVYYNWVVDAPATLPWYLRYVEWLQMPWRGRFRGEPPWRLFDTFPISPDEEHRRVVVEVRATFAFPYPDPWLGFQNTKTRSRAITFRLFTHDEMCDFSRGISSIAHWDPPNWFDARPGHWGAVIPRFNEMDPNLDGGYVVYYAPRPPSRPGTDITDTTVGILDWSGYWAPYGLQHSEQYRGRVYLFVSSLKVRIESGGAVRPYGLWADGIDAVANTVAHELAERDLFLASWGGFDSAHIGSYLFHPFRRPYDEDMDGVRDSWEHLHRSLGFGKDDPYAVERWWLYGKDATGREVCTVLDHEMYAQLFGEWNGYLVGSLDEQDWSEGGRQDY